MAKLSGVGAAVLISGVQYDFTKFDVDIETSLPNSNTFTDAGYQSNVAGVSKVDVTLESKSYNQGANPFGGPGSTFATGAQITLTLQLSPTLSMNLPIRLGTCKVSADYDGTVSLNITGTSNGAFTFNLT